MGGDGFGFRPRISIMDTQLRLDPDIERRMQELEADMAAKTLLDQWRQPNFQLLLPQWDSIIGAPPNPMFAQPPPPGRPSSTPTPSSSREPDPPRPGQISDVVSALYRLPSVQNLVGQAHDEGLNQLRQLKSEWNQAGTGDRVAMVSFSTVVVGTMVTAVMANQPSRNAVLGLIRGKDIPIPGVDGLSFVVMDRGGGVTAPLGVRGLTASGHYNAPAGRQPDYGITVNLDVMELLKK